MIKMPRVTHIILGCAICGYLWRLRVDRLGQDHISEMRCSFCHVKGQLHVHKVEVRFE